jgi:hypothetical protein
MPGAIDWDSLVGSLKGMRTEHARVTFFLVDDWTWWAWLAIVVLLTIGLSGPTDAFLVAWGISLAQTTGIFFRERELQAFPVQLRLAYTILLSICLLPGMHWLFWLPTLGTWALVIFGYCLLARVLSLLPWNRQEPLSVDLLHRTFFSRPTLPPKSKRQTAFACAGGLCTIQAQVRPAHR